MTTPAGFAIKAVQHEDIPVLAKLSAEAFKNDSHTEMKDLGKVPYDMEKHALESFPGQLENPKYVVLKAEENITKSIMGFCIWAFRGFGPEEIPVIEDAPPKKVQGPSAASSGPPESGNQEDMREESIKQLEAQTNEFMSTWMEEIMPPGTKCLIVVGLCVSPEYQRRGVGSALLKWGTDIVDAKGVFAWVSSSDGAKDAYAKAGFEVARSFTLNLDKYAPTPAPVDRYKDGKWGGYTWWKMVYQSATFKPVGGFIRSEDGFGNDNWKVCE